MSSEDTDFIRQRVLRTLSSNRAPGFNFAGYFYDLKCQRFEKDGVLFGVAPGVHCAGADGIADRAAVLYLADTTLAAANRVHLNPDVRTATTILRVEFTGEPARGTLEASGRSDGFTNRTALPEGVAVGRVTADGREIMRMSGTWVSPPAPPGRTMTGLPWEGGTDGRGLPLLKKRDLDAAEKDLTRRFNRAMRNSPDGLPTALWHPVVKRTPRGASGKMPVGMHIGNRVGHVQGGFLFNMAITTAEAAVPDHPIITAASAWYISPGQGKAITAKSTILQQGRNVAVVRTELFATGGKLVLETISNHAIAAQSSS